MKLKIAILSLSLIAVSAAFAQDTTEPRYAVAGGVDSGIFTSFSYRLGQNTSTYTKLQFNGTGAGLSQGLSQTILRIDRLSMAVAGDVGVTSHGQMALGFGFVPAYDLSQLTKIKGLSVIGIIQAQRFGAGFAPNLGIGLSKSF